MQEWCQQSIKLESPNIHGLPPKTREQLNANEGMASKVL